MKYCLLLVILTGSFLVCYSKQCRILTLSGGGAHGSFQAGVLKRLDEKGLKWDVITGISVGSLNGILISAYPYQNQTDAINLLKGFWFNITDSQVYTRNWNPVWSGSVYDSTPLNKTLYKIVSDFKVRRDIIVGATRINNGKLDIFNKHSLVGGSNITDILMSSTAIPVYFPPRFFNGNYYMDGGLTTNELIYPAVRHCRDSGMEDIVIDVVRCSRPIRQLTSKEISKDNIFKLTYRTYEIASNALFHHELYANCDPRINFNRVYPMYIYKPEHDFPGGLLDFSHDKMVENFNMGYNTTNPTVTRWCH